MTNNPWELHVVANDQNSAVAAAAERRSAYDPGNFTNPTVAEEFTNDTRTVAVLSLASAKKQPDWPTARASLRDALAVFARDYPLATDNHEGERRLAYWNEGMPEDEALYVCLRDLYGLAELLLQLVRPENPQQAHEYDDIHLWARGLMTLTQKLVDAGLDPSNPGQTERFALMFIIEESKRYSRSVRAYHSFIRLFGQGTRLFQTDQVVTMSMRMFGRAIDHADVVTALLCFRNMKQAVKADPSRTDLSRRDLIKNFSATVKKMFLAHRYRVQWRNWNQQQPEAEPFLADVRALTRNVFIGTHAIVDEGVGQKK